MLTPCLEEKFKLSDFFEDLERGLYVNSIKCCCSPCRQDILTARIAASCLKGASGIMGHLRLDTCRKTQLLNTKHERKATTRPWLDWLMGGKREVGGGCFGATLITSAVLLAEPRFSTSQDLARYNSTSTLTPLTPSSN